MPCPQENGSSRAPPVCMPTARLDSRHAFLDNALASRFGHGPVGGRIRLYATRGESEADSTRCDFSILLHGTLALTLIMDNTIAAPSLRVNESSAFTVATSIWRIAEKAEKDGRFAAAAGWYLLGVEPMFANTGLELQAKLARYVTLECIECVRRLLHADFDPDRQERHSRSRAGGQYGSCAIGLALVCSSRRPREEPFRQILRIRQ